MKKTINKKNLRYVLILLALSYVFLMLGNGILSLTNPDEVFYTQTAKEMIQHNSWMTPYLFGKPQFEKPILLYWLLRSGFALFGINSFAGRFFPAFFAVLGVIAVYFLGLLGFKNEKKAFISSLVLMSAGLYIGLARTVFTDMIFSIFVLFSLLSFYWGYSVKSRRGVGIVLFFVFSALAVLTKGPLGILIPFVTAILFLAIKKEIRFFFCKYSLWGILFFAAIAFPWYILMINKYGDSFNHEFFYNDHVRRLFEAEHKKNDTWFFYPLSMVGGMFPWSLYTLAGIFYLFKDLKREVKPVYLFLISWILAVLFIFQPAHSKLSSYIFPVFPALVLVTGDFIYNSALLENRNRVFFMISLITLFFFLLTPIGFIAALHYSPIPLSSKVPVYILSFILLILSLLIGFFISRFKFFKTIYLTAFFIPPILFGAFAIHNDLEPYVSSREACEFLLKNYSVSAPVLTSKAFVRGVRFYSDKEVAILDSPRSFFSPHPVAFVDTDAEIINFFQARPVTYCVIDRDSEDKIMNKVFREKFSITPLKTIGKTYILEVRSGVKG